VLKDVTDLRKKQEQEVQLQLARQVQQRFYRAPIRLSGFDLAAACYPASETGGDYFDFIPTSSDSAYVAIGDASGHGFGSALVMALTRAYVRSLTALGLPVGEILTRVNALLMSDLEDNRFVTLLLARLDARGHALSYANAGHVPGFILDGAEKVESVMASTGPPLGLFAESEFGSCEMRLASRRVILLMTDGLTESAVGDGQPFGPERAIEYVRAHIDRQPDDIVGGLCQAARLYAGDGPQTDDITSVLVKVQ
jgi:sigma-B regulation protein RsbU (phosphoserine phosphatase)